jgi:predicted nuclease with TOPRIM domain
MKKCRYCGGPDNGHSMSQCILYLQVLLEESSDKVKKYDALLAQYNKLRGYLPYLKQESSLVEAANNRLRSENSRLKKENKLLRTSIEESTAHVLINSHRQDTVQKQKELAVQFFKEGKSHEDIADRLGRSRETITRWLNAEGLQRRPRKKGA